MKITKTQLKKLIKEELGDSIQDLGDRDDAFAAKVSEMVDTATLAQEYFNEARDSLESPDERDPDVSRVIEEVDNIALALESFLSGLSDTKYFPHRE